MSVVPFSLRDAPALIERLLPVQKLSAESYKEQMAVHGKTLTALGSYWKGRKPLILNKACILGCLLPATNDPTRDLEIFERLLGMDEASFAVRWKRRPRPEEVAVGCTPDQIAARFQVGPKGKLAWRAEVSELERRTLEAAALPPGTYRDWVDAARRPEEVIDSVDAHIWDEVNQHLGTTARTFPELVEQLGIMRFGHRPRVADRFSGSGQIPFEAARLGCDVYASDLNPIACMLTWGALNIVGASPERRAELAREQKALVERVTRVIDELGIESDGQGWRAKVFLYCVEVRCPQSGWSVPLLASRVISKGSRVIAELVPDAGQRRYGINIRSGVTEAELVAAEEGTIRRDARHEEAYVFHEVAGVSYKTRISTLRGDNERPDGTTGNRLRLWEVSDFRPRSDDLLQERLYCVQWMRPKAEGSRQEYEFRGVTADDLRREEKVEAHVAAHLAEWQAAGHVPDMRIEVGGPPRYQGLDLVRSRGWTYWHHAFNPRQLLLAYYVSAQASAAGKLGLTQLLNLSCRLSRVDTSPAGAGATKGAFDNQALNTLFTYGCRASAYGLAALADTTKTFPLPPTSWGVTNAPAGEVEAASDLFITDPPYGDAVKYEEILDFFIAWLRRNPPPEFADWTWDSRRALAIQGEGEDFRRGMVAAYRRMAECMPDNGIQIIMFTHLSPSLWADMANIVWAAGLWVSAAWYVVTETDSALRDGSHVKGTVLLVLRKRRGHERTTRDDLAWDIQDEVKRQVADLVGLNQRVKGRNRNENVFEDADLQMAGYAAALRVLTRYATIDGRDMATEATRPRVKGETTFVDELIDFAVRTANECLVPRDLDPKTWQKLKPAERFYLKMVELEAGGTSTLDNFQNFAKAFKVREHRALMADQRANHARLKTAVELGSAEMSEGAELSGTVLRAVLYALRELQAGMDGTEVLIHLSHNIPDYYSGSDRRAQSIELAGYLAHHGEQKRPEEASAARVLRDLLIHQRVG